MRKLSLKDEMSMVVVKLMLNLHANDIGQRMGIDAATVSCIFH